MTTADVVTLALPGRHRGRRKYLRDLIDGLTLVAHQLSTWLRGVRDRLTADLEERELRAQAYRSALAWQAYALTVDSPDSDLVADASTLVAAAGAQLSALHRLTLDIEHQTRH